MNPENAKKENFKQKGQEEKGDHINNLKQTNIGVSKKGIVREEDERTRGMGENELNNL